MFGTARFGVVGHQGQTALTFDPQNLMVDGEFPRIRVAQQLRSVW